MIIDQTIDTGALDAIQRLLNPVQSQDLQLILSLTLAERRVAVAQAFAGISLHKWALTAGVGASNAYRWLTERDHRLPFGAAYRLAYVLQVDAGQLFADYL